MTIVLVEMSSSQLDDIFSISIFLKLSQLLMRFKLASCIYKCTVSVASDIQLWTKIVAPKDTLSGPLFASFCLQLSRMHVKSDECFMVACSHRVLLYASVLCSLLACNKRGIQQMGLATIFGHTCFEPFSS